MKSLLIVACVIIMTDAAAQHVGIGNTNPAYKLDISGRLRLRGGANEFSSAGLWLSGYGADSLTEKSFIGMQSDTTMGVYGNGNGWKFLIDYRTGNTGFAGSTPDPGVTVTMGSSTGDKLSLYRDGNGNNYGFGVGSAALQLMLPHSTGNILFGYGRSTNLTELVRISGNGGLAIGSTNTSLAGLTVNKKTGAVHALFGSNTTGVAIESSFPGIGFNTYYNGNRLAIANGYGGYIGVNPLTGEMQLAVSPNSKNADEIIAVNTAIAIKANGNVGIGITDPAYILDVGARMRVRSSTGNTSGIWFNNDANNASPAFIGMNSDTEVGFFGQGTGWSFKMNTVSGAISFGGNTGTSGQVLTSNGSSGAPVWKTPGDGKPYVVRPVANSPDLGTSGQVDVPGMVANFTLTDPSQVVFHYKLSIANRGCVACGDRRTFIELYQNIIGGTLRVATTTVYTPNGEIADAVSGPIVVNLPAGTYSYKIVLSPSIYGAANVYARQQEGILTWQIYPD